jgi:hypothetical protein
MAAAGPLAALASSGRAAALAPTSSGYWVKFGAPNPTVPKGGLLVASDPTTATNPASPVGSKLPVGAAPPTVPGVPGSDVVGPAAISAVRITGVAPGQDATLTLQVAPGSVAPPATVTTVVACGLTAGLQGQPPQGGDISKAPGYDCSSASAGRVAGDQSSVSWLLPAAMQATPGELDVALVPDPAGEPVAFSVAFGAPGSTSVQASSGPPSAPPPTTAPTGGDVTAPSQAPFVATVVPGGGGGNPIPYFAPPAATPAPLAPAPAPASRAAGSPQLALGRLAGAHLPGDDRAHRLMAVVVLMAMAAGWWYVGGQPTRQPHLLGALGGASASQAAPVRVGGVGRFSRPRPGGPRRL